MKGRGGYIMVAPSIHPSGKRYQWDGIEGAKALLQLADPPAWLGNLIRAKQNGAPSEASKRGDTWKVGERNSELTSLAGAMRHRGMSREAIELALVEENRQRCNPPLAEAEARAIAASVARYSPAARAGAETQHAGSLVTRCLSDVEAKPVPWLWPGRIARGKLTIISGHPGLGKSQVTASIAGTVTTGGTWPVDHERPAIGSVILLNAEDDAVDTLRPRLEAAGADLARVHVIDGVIRGYTGAGDCQSGMFSLEEDLTALEAELTKIGDVAVVVIDPITAYLGKTDSHRNADVRGMLAPLSALATRQSVAVIAVSHLSKAAGAKALMRVTGSLAFVAAARAAYLVAADPQDKARRLFLPLKNNLAPDSSGLAFRVEGATIDTPGGALETSRVVWENEPVSITADEALHADAMPGDHSSAREAAADWLSGKLAGGEMAAADLSKVAKVEGITEKALRGAREVLGVVTRKGGMQGGWLWSLPREDAQPAQDAQHKNGGTFGHLGEAGEEL